MFSPKTLKFIFTERSNERCLPKTDIQWQNGFNRGFVCASIFGTDEIFIGQTRRQVDTKFCISLQQKVWYGTKCAIEWRGW